MISKTAPRKRILVILVCYVIFSFFSSFGHCGCLSSHSSQNNHPVTNSNHNYNHNYDYYSTNNVINEKHGEASRNYFGGKYDGNFVDRQRQFEAELAVSPSPDSDAPWFNSGPKIVSVDDYLGSNGQGNADYHNQAFKKAFKKACYRRGGVFLVPKNKEYKLRPMTFSGPCHSSFTIKIMGTIKASENISDYHDRTHWLVFDNLRNFQVQGDGGTIDGNGRIWWQNSCKINKNKPCQHAPTAITFVGCKNFRVEGLRITNAQQMHLTFQRCANVRAFNLMVIAPANSPNTDGIHISQTRNIIISNALIRTGDDCISIVSGSKNVRATDITCGPGHGIRVFGVETTCHACFIPHHFNIGSLGEGNSKAQVANVWVSRAILSGTTNGVRIKTWQGGSGYAKNIIFENIVMHNVSNPIIIDQHYCDQQKPCQEMNSSVEVSNVLYKDIKGSSATEIGVKLDCSKRHICKGIVFENVKLGTQQNQPIKADCLNVHLLRRGQVSPICLPPT